MVQCEKQQWNFSSTGKQFANQKLYDESVASNRSKSLSHYNFSKCDVPIKRAIDDVRQKVRTSLQSGNKAVIMNERNSLTNLGGLNIQGKQMQLNSPSNKNRHGMGGLGSTHKSLKST